MNWTECRLTTEEAMAVLEHEGLPSDISDWTEEDTRFAAHVLEIAVSNKTSTGSVFHTLPARRTPKE